MFDNWVYYVAMASDVPGNDIERNMYTNVFHIFKEQII
jgi:hypothetical protein